MSNLKAWALYYAKRGWYVFPVAENGVVPKLQNGYHGASNDPVVVAAWWDKWPQANIGINLAKSGMMGFDIDPQNGGDVSHREQFAHVDSPLKSSTPSGGQHMLFKVPDGVRVNPKPGKGIDGKWNGYVILPPSVRKGVQGKPDGVYRWQGNGAELPAVMPDCLAAEDLPPPIPSDTPISADISDLPAIREALNHLNDFGDFRAEAWTDVGMALHHWQDMTEGAGEAGWQLFKEWSLRDPKGSFDEVKCRKRWDSFKSNRDRAITLGTVFLRAQRAGWTGKGGLSAALVIQAFGGGPREPAPWTTEAVPGFGEQQEPSDLLSDQITHIDWFSDAWNKGKVHSVARSLAWATGSNCEAVLAVFKLHHELKDSPALRSSIAEACRSQTEWKGITPERRKWQDAPNIAPTAEVTEFEDLHVAELGKTTNDHMKDAQQLQRITFSDRLASFEGAVHWWTGCRWAPVSDALLRRHTGRALNTPDSKLSSSRIAGTVAVLRDQVPMMGEIDPPSLLIPFINGVLDMTTGELAPHTPAVRNSRIVSVPYNPAATCDQWSAWLADIFETDRGRVALLQEVIGWCMCSDNLGIQKAVTLIGVSRAGKGTILGILSRLLGSAAGAFQLGDLTDSKVLAGMRSKNVAIDYDAASPEQKIARQVTGRFKAITANEPLSIQLLYTQEPLQVALNCKLILAANSVPTLWDDSGAAANRWVPLVFDKQFAGVEDTGLQDRLATELEGIAVWAIEGLRRLMAQRRFTMPVSSRDELDSLVDAASPLDRFVDECCKTEAGIRCSEDEVWSVYETWMRSKGMEANNRKGMMKAFRDAVRGRGAVWKKSIRVNSKTTQGFDGLTVEFCAIKGAPGNVYNFPKISPPEL